jgi:hypothetical protein
LGQLFRLFSSLFLCYLSFSDILQEFYKLMDICTDRRALSEYPGKSSRSQGTTTKSGGDVCGRVKWAAPEIT